MTRIALTSAGAAPGEALLRRITSAVDESALLGIASETKRFALVDPTEALRISEALLERTDGAHPRARGLALVARGNALCLLKRVEEAVEALAEARWIAASVEDPAFAAEVEMSSVQPLAMSGRLVDAERHAERAVTLFERGARPTEAAMARVNRAIILRMCGRPADALQQFDRARPLLDTQPLQRAVVESNRAEALLDLDRYDEALHAFEAAIAAFDTSDNYHAAAIVQGNIAHLLGRQGRYDEALHQFEAAKRRFELCGATGDVARLESEEAETLAAVGDLQEAIERFTSAHRRFEHMGLQREAAAAQLGAAQAFLERGELGSAAAAAEGAANRFRAIGNSHGAADAACILARLTALRGDHGAALAEFETLLSQYTDRPARRAAIELAIAELCLATGDMEGAETRAGFAQAALEWIRQTPLEVQLAHIRARIAMGRGQREAARRAFREALAIVDLLRSTLRRDTLRAALHQSTFAVHHDAMRMGLDCGDADGQALAFEALERFRGRTLLDLVCAVGVWTSAAADEMTQQLIASHAECETRLRVAFGRLDSLRQAHADTGAWRAVHAQVESIERELGALHARISAAGRERPMVGAPLVLEQSLSRIPRSARIVCFYVDGDSIGAMVLSAGRCQVRRGLIPRARLQELVASYRFQVERALARGPMRSAAGSMLASLRAPEDGLYRALLAPLEEDLAGAARVGVVPVGELHGLPLGALGGEQHRWLSRFEVYYLPSVSIAAALSTRNETCGRLSLDLLAVGVPDEDAPFMADEARIVVAGRRRAATLLGSEATVERVFERASDARVVHLATHSVFSAANPGSSRMRFANGWLTAREIARKRLRCRTIVLAGCDTARSAGDSGEERHGLIRAFLAAGATTVIGSLWRLHDGASRNLFGEFYAGADLGQMSVGAKLRQVQCNAASSGAHPAFWSSLIVTGGWE